MYFYEQTCEKTRLPEGTMALDIETAGLARDRDPVFLIGGLLGGADADHLFQWAIDTTNPKEERALLEAVRPYFAAHPILTYNGDAFDLPYLAHRARRHGMDWLLPTSIDLYRRLRSQKKLLDLPDLRLQTLERYLGIERTDQLSGAEVAQGFWALSRGEGSLHPLLLHNREDVLHTARLLDFFAEWDQVRSWTIVWQSQTHTCFLDEVKRQKEFLTLTFSIDPSLPLPLQAESDHARLVMQKNQGHLRLPTQQARFGEAAIDVAGEAGLADQSPYQLQAPLLCLGDADRFFTKNLCAIAARRSRRLLQQL